MFVADKDGEAMRFVGGVIDCGGGMCAVPWPARDLHRGEWNGGRIRRVFLAGVCAGACTNFHLRGAGQGGRPHVRGGARG